jgi:RluA family pseudouridine synthase
LEAELWRAECEQFSAFEPGWEIFRDRDLLIVDKPSGLLCHPGSDARRPDLMTLLRKHYEGAFAEIVLQHRLDRETSGLVVLTVSPEARIWVYRQFEQRRVSKKYLAWVRDPKKVLQPSFFCERPLRVDNQGRVRVAEGGGQASSTAFRLIRRSGPFALLEASPTTGRKHQIRVHLESLGHPIVGDELYRGSRAPRLMLHAAEVRLEDTRLQVPVRFQAAAPPNFTV